MISGSSAIFGKLQSRTEGNNASLCKMQPRTAGICADFGKLQSRTTRNSAIFGKLQSRTAGNNASLCKMQSRTVENCIDLGKMQSRTNRKNCHFWQDSLQLIQHYRKGQARRDTIKNYQKVPFLKRCSSEPLKTGLLLVRCRLELPETAFSSGSRSRAMSSNCTAIFY